MTPPFDFIPRRDADAVVIGASAGGVQALQTLLGALDADFAPAVLVVLHLSPGRESLMAELLDAACALPVAEALDKQPVRGGTVTLAPPDYHLLVEPERCLALSVDDPVLFSRPAIDPLFESAAAAYGPRLLALLLTGASTDGSAGLAAVRRRGGQAWVQDPASASAATMPAAALAHAGADAVLTLDQMCRRLAARSE
ncbi:chemotaxis protein CheB [uncultured Azohydromonas sp.]|uniref:chemotaxis protein CheB n=1 Tax=uncultured Azohydromonas sp. TaxID=487342 RepID=UPI0026337088|nr:chemotaxis protein CheB [uncultured Azohydromonas sp.]